MLDNNNYSSDKPSTSLAWPLALPPSFAKTSDSKKIFFFSAATAKRQIKLAVDYVKKIKKVLCEVTKIKNITSKTLKNQNMHCKCFDHKNYGVPAGKICTIYGKGL